MVRLEASLCCGLGLSLAFVLAGLSGSLRAGEEGAKNASVPGAFEVDPPTLNSLGLSWLIQGDANCNAALSLEYRKATAEGKEPWRPAAPLFRAMDSHCPKDIKSPQSYFFKVEVPAGTWRFAGSVWDLTPDTEYELRVKLADPDGGAAEKVLKARTRAEPVRVGGGRKLYVKAEGAPGGSGTKEAPFVGLKAAQEAAEAGDTFFLLPGVYKGTFNITKTGVPGQPIIWRAALLGDGRKLGPDGKPEEVILDAEGKTAIAVGVGADCLTFDGLTIRNADMGVMANGAGDITIRYCRFQAKTGVMAQHPRQHAVENFYVADNVFEGPHPWPRVKMDGTEGVNLSGSGHTVCHNRIRGYTDGFSVGRAPKNFAMDIHNNDFLDCIDDGAELDYSDYNTRFYRNRMTNVFQALSFQPVRGGPVFAFRNIIYNQADGSDMFKLHNYTSGALIVHNTTIKKGTALHSGTPEAARNFHYFNNLFVGQGKGLAANFGLVMEDSRFDYNGLAGDGFSGYIRWSKGPWLSLEKAKAEGPVQKNGALFSLKDGTLFANPEVKPPEDDKKAADPKFNDPQLKEQSPAIDKGLPMPGFNDEFKGQAPDLGAYEFGVPPPLYGPRPDPEVEAAKAGAAKPEDAKPVKN